jgi:LEA14-like dessication related protein
MHPSIKKLLLFILLFSLNGCAELAKHTETIRPTAKITGAHLANINFNQADLVFDLAVENNNPVSLALASLDYDFKLENQSVVSGVTAKAMKLNANSTSTVQLPVTLKFDDLKKLPGELWNKDKLAYDLQTTFNITLPIIGNYAVPVAKKGELPVPKIPDIKLKDIQVKSMSFTSAEVLAQVEVSNPNNFQLGLKSFDYQLNVNQKNWGQGNIKQAINIPEKGKGIIEIPVKLDLMSIGAALYPMLQKKAPLQYQLKGNASIDTGLELLKNYNMPVDVSGTAAIQ